jgi:hypothetical protein
VRPREQRQRTAENCGNCAIRSCSRPSQTRGALAGWSGRKRAFIADRRAAWTAIVGVDERGPDRALAPLYVPLSEVRRGAERRAFGEIYTGWNREGLTVAVDVTDVNTSRGRARRRRRAIDCGS